MLRSEVTGQCGREALRVVKIGFDMEGRRRRGRMSIG